MLKKKIVSIVLCGLSFCVQAQVNAELVGDVLTLRGPVAGTPNIVQTTGKLLVNGATNNGSTGLQVNGGALINGYTQLANTGINGNTNINGFYDDPINMYGNRNRLVRMYMENLYAGTNAGAGLLCQNNTGAQLMMFVGSSLNYFVPNGVLFRSTGSGGINFVADGGIIAFGRSPWTGGAEHARFFYNGNFSVGSTTDDGVNKIQVTGTVKATSYVLTQTVMPSSSTDPVGQVGEIRADDNYLYFKTSTGWKRAGLAAF